MHIFTRYADEKKALFIARAICEKRKTEKIDTTFKLLRIIEDASFDAKSAPRVFQALRIAVNDELESLKMALAAAERCLAPHGRLAVITFHSLEDRIVKQAFASPSWTPITKKPVTHTMANR